MRRYRNRVLTILLTVIAYIIYHLYTGQPFPRVSPNNAPKSTQFLLPSPPTSSDSANFGIVKRVVDGDTIELDNGKTLRYIGIDTPETKHPTKGVECYGEEAYKKNKELVEGKRVQLEKDVSEMDRYGRLLRYVYVLPDDASRSATLLINQYLVQEGYAHAVTFPPDVKYTEYFKNIEREAREKNKGLWSACTITP